MDSKPDDFLVQAWKQQLDMGLRVMEALVEAATKLREMQLNAATRAHADIEAARRSLASAHDVAQLLEVQRELASQNAQKCVEYWRSCYDLAMRTQTDLAGCFAARGLPAAPVDDSKQALLSMLDKAYKQWFEATQQLYKLPGAQSAAGKATTAGNPLYR